MSETQSQTPGEQPETLPPPTETTPPSSTQPEIAAEGAAKPEAKATLLNKDEAAKPEGAPEAYADFKLPEGVELKGEALTAATGLFKDLGLSQANAQRLVDFHVAQVKAAQEATEGAVGAMAETWAAETLADPEVGPRMAKVKENIGRAYDAIINANPEKAPEARALVAEFKAVMDTTGIGNNRAFVKLFNRFAERLIEPGHVAGKGPANMGADGRPLNGNPGLAASMYGNPKTQ